VPGLQGFAPTYARSLPPERSRTDNRSGLFCGRCVLPKRPTGTSSSCCGSTAWSMALRRKASSGQTIAEVERDAAHPYLLSPLRPAAGGQNRQHALGPLHREEIGDLRRRKRRPSGAPAVLPTKARPGSAQERGGGSLATPAGITRGSPARSWLLRSTSGTSASEYQRES